MTLSKLSALLLAVTLMVVPGIARAQKPALQVALAGEWDGPLALDAGVHHLSLIFKLADTTLTGYALDNEQNFGSMDELKVSGDTVRFLVQGLLFTGVVSGRTMNIDLIVFNGSHRKMTVSKIDEKAKPERDDASRE
jgi:hypothetical protein